MVYWILQSEKDMSDYDFDYEIKRLSNRSSEATNPQTRSLSIIVGFNALFQATDYHYVDLSKIRSNRRFLKAVNEYMVTKRISMKNIVFYPIFLNSDGLIDCAFEFEQKKGAKLAGFGFFLKKDLRVAYSVVKITSAMQERAFRDLKKEIKAYNSFLYDDVWLIVVSKPHGRNFVVYGRDLINEKLDDIANILQKKQSTPIRISI